MPSKFMKQDSEITDFDKPAQELDGNFPKKTFIPAAPEPIKSKYYEKASWKGVKDIFRCIQCGECRDEESEGMNSIILHVVTHVPESERDDLFYKLIGEK